MRKLFCIAILVLVAGCESTGGFQDLLNAGTNSQGGNLSNETIADGLREALTVGSDRVVSSLGSEDGFLKSAFHIPLPAKLQEARGVASKFGLEGPFDELEVKMNRAAEQATPKARDLFVGAIKQMSFDDVLSIYRGGDDAATQYLQKTTGAELEQEMRPIIDKSLAEVGAVQTFNTLVKKYNALPLVTPVSADLDTHVLKYTETAIFGQLAKEEAAIRTNPVERSTALLRQVFGK